MSILVSSLPTSCEVIYCRFIKYFSSIASSLTALTKRDVKFVWSPAAENAFQLLKLRSKCSLITAPILMQFDQDRIP